jgi:predicted double-glycine peptidase
MRLFYPFFVIVILTAGIIQPAHAEATNPVYLESGGGNYMMKNGQSLLDKRFRGVVRQKYDFSCGSAAVATLLTYHYGHPVEEMDVLSAMFETGDQEKIRKEGFSLLDMKNYLESIGYRAEGYKESLDKLSKVGIPAIVLINKHGYMHFVVVKGVTKTNVSVGDPTLGLRIYDRSDFEKMWNGIIFVVLNDKNIAKSTFNRKENWSSNGNPNFRHMLDRGELGALTIDISITPNYY